MATLRVASVPAVAPMKVAQITRPEEISRLSNPRFPSRAQDRCGSRFRPVASATVTCLRKKALGLAFSIRGFPDMKQRASSTQWAKEFPSGSRTSALASDGTAGMMARVSRAGAEIFVLGTPKETLVATGNDSKSMSATSSSITLRRFTLSLTHPWQA